MKRLLIYWMLFISLVHAEDVSVEFHPKYPISGDVLSVIVKAKVPLTLNQEIPKVADWRSGSGIRRGSQSINGDATYYFIMQYVPDKEGDYEFPAIKVNVNGKEVVTKSQKISIMPNKTITEKDKIIQTSILFNGSENLPEKIYPGVIFTIDYKVSVVRGWNYVSKDALNDYRPQIKADDMHVIVNRGFMENNYFQEITEETIQDGIPYSTVTYRFRLAPVKSGDYEFLLGQKVYAVKKVPGLPRNEVETKTIDLQKKLHVVPLPLPPAGIDFLEIAGDWQVKADLSKKSVKTGETFELILQVTGSEGDIQRLNAPVLNIPGFEVDSKPEINFLDNAATIKYSLRALKKVSFPPLVFATFDHRENKFREYNFLLNLEIDGEEIKTSSGELVTDQNNSSIKDKPELYRYENQKSLLLPLYLNISPGWYLAILFSPMLFLLVYLKVKRGEKSVKTGDSKRDFQKRVENICQRLESEKNIGLVNEEILPLLNEWLKLPPGTTVHEMVENLPDKELGEMILKLSEEAYLPGARQGFNMNLLIGKLKNIMVMGLIFLFSNSISADVSQEKIEKDFKTGNYKSALEGFRKLSEEDNANVVHFKNLALTAIELKDDVLALASLERAIRLEPEDGQIRQKIVDLRNRLKLTQKDGFENLRDWFRPDQWFRAAALVWIIWWLILTLQLIGKRSGKKWSCIICGSILSVVLIILLTQIKSTYRNGQFMLIDKVSINGKELSPGMEFSGIEIDGRVKLLHSGEEVDIEGKKVFKIW